MQDDQTTEWLRSVEREAWWRLRYGRRRGLAVGRRRTTSSGCRPPLAPNPRWYEWLWPISHDAGALQVGGLTTSASNRRV